MKKFLIWTGSILGVIVVALLCYKYSWRLFGFNTCAKPTAFNISNISVSEKSADISVWYLGDSTSRFEGYTYKVKDDILYIGIKTLPFMASGGFFPNDIHIETKEPFSKIVLTNGKAEQQIYPKEV